MPKGLESISQKPEIVVKDNTKEVMPAIRNIAGITFGEEYACVLDSCISINAEIDGVVVGYGTASIDYVENICLEDHIQLFVDLYPFQVGIIGNVATHPDYQRKGVGYEITKELVKRLRLLGQKTIIGSAWRSKHGINIGSVLTKIGFTPVIEIDEFWKGQPCIQCGDCCTCPAVIFELRLD